MAFFATLKPDQIGLAAIVTLTVVGLIRGWLVPQSVHTERIADKNQQITALGAERDQWRTAFQKSEEGRSLLTTQNDELIKGAETTNRLMESLRNQIERAGLSAPTGGTP